MRNNLLLKKFEPLPYGESFEILSKASSVQPPETKKLLMVIGANGSGKSTVIANLYQNKQMNLPYVNADLILKQQFLNVQDETAKNEKAMFYTVNMVKNLLQSGKSFCYESVFSHPSKLELLKIARKQGYEICVIFVSTNSPEINIKRVAKRVGEGGHNVSKEKILEKYDLSNKNAIKSIEYCTQFFDFDNSKDLELTKKYHTQEMQQEKT